MKNIADVSGIGRNATRIDKNMVNRISNSAKIQNASGGPYGNRADLENLASGASTDVATPDTNMGQSAIPVTVSGAFDERNHGLPFSQGAVDGPGAGSEVLQTPVDAVDQGELLIRAMYFLNPTPQLERIVRAYNDQKTYQ